MRLPAEYERYAIEAEFDRVQRVLTDLNTVVKLSPLSSAPLGAESGWLAISDGTGSGFDGASGAGLYRYNGSAWVHLG